MVQDRIDIVIVDKISPTIAPKLDAIALAATQAQRSLMGVRGAAAVGAGSQMAANIDRVGTSAKKTNRQLVSLGASLRFLFLAYFAAAAAERILSIADAFKELENRLSLVTDTADQTASVLYRLYEVSQRSYTDLSAITRSFQRFDLAMRAMGGGQEETIRMTETIAKMLQLTGSTAQEARSGMLQLSQAFNKGKLDGDEFRTVMETMPLVAQALKNELGLTKRQMYQMARQGQLTTDILRRGLAASAKDTDDAFEKLNKTLGHAVTQLKNEALFLFGQMNKKIGGTDGMVGAVESLTENLIVAVAALEGLHEKLREFTESEVVQTFNQGWTAYLDWGLDARAWGKIKEWLNLEERAAKKRAELESARKDNLRGEGDGEWVPDFGHYDKYLAKLRRETELLEQITWLKGKTEARQYVQKRTDARSFGDIDWQMWQEMYAAVEKHENAKMYARHLDGIYWDTKGALRDLREETYALDEAFASGWVSADTYRVALAGVQAEAMRVNAAMGKGNNLVNSFKLAMLDLESTMPTMVEALADVWLSAIDRMTEGIGQLIAQWAVFGDSMRFIDVFRGVVRQMIAELVKLTAQYMIVAFWRQMAGFAAPATATASTNASPGFQLGGPPTLSAPAAPTMMAGGYGAPGIVINNQSGVALDVEYVSSNEVRLIAEDTVRRQAGAHVAREISDPNSKVSRSMRQHTQAGRRGS